MLGLRRGRQKLPKLTVFQAIQAGYWVKFSTSNDHASEEPHRLQYCLCERFEGRDLSCAPIWTWNDRVVTCFKLPCNQTSGLGDHTGHFYGTHSCQDFYITLASHRPCIWKGSQKPLPVSKQFPYGLGVRIASFYPSSLGSTSSMGRQTLL